MNYIRYVEVWRRQAATLNISTTGHILSVVNLNFGFETAVVELYVSGGCHCVREVF